MSAHFDTCLSQQETTRLSQQGTAIFREPGAFVITVEYGKDLKNKDWFGKQDPYCILSYGSQKARTKTKWKAGSNPVWHEDFFFDALPDDDTMYISVMDEDLITKDDLLGICTISCHKARAQGSERIVAPVISKKGKEQGLLSVTVKFTPTTNLQRNPTTY